MSTNVISQDEIAGLRWLAQEAGISDFLFGHVLSSVRLCKSLYTVISIPKNNGGFRNLNVPDLYLMKVQRAINKNVLCEFPVYEAAFGFSGGNIVDAINPHLRSKVLLSFDIVKAFEKVSLEDVMACLLENREEDYWEGIQEFGKLSWYAARAISQISTIKNTGRWYDTCLPQGAPTSPRLFDLAFKSTDYALSFLVRKYGGIYTRYADNIFISLVDKTYLAPKIERAIFRTLANKWRWWRPQFLWHKRSVRRLDRGAAVRMLGLNIIDGKITVPRDYKRNLRLAIHHVRYLLAHNLPHEEAWLRLNGQMAHAFRGFLPNRLVINYEDLREEVEYLQSLDS